MEKKSSIYALLQRMRKSKCPDLVLEEIEDNHGKDTKLDVMIADYTDRLQRKGFNVVDYLSKYNHWNSYERMKLLHFRLQELEDPVIMNIINIIKTVNESFTKDQMMQIQSKMREQYFAVLCVTSQKVYFKVIEDYYDTLKSLYYEKIPNILL